MVPSHRPKRFGSNMLMKVFISWSGAKSKALANALREWIPNVIQFVDPWMSSEDIDKGARWSSDIADQLEKVRVGIICLTSDNLDSPWILFEAGALSKTLDKTYVCPYLLDIDQADIRGPLVQFQMTLAEKDDTKKLLHTINNALEGSSLSENRLNSAFEQWWPSLEDKLKAIHASAPPTSPNIPGRSDRDIL